MLQIDDDREGDPSVIWPLEDGRVTIGDQG